MKQPLCRDLLNRCSHAVLSQKARHVFYSGLLSHFVRQKIFEISCFMGYSLFRDSGPKPADASNFVGFRRINLDEI